MRGFIVLGPERSGTRMLTEALISSGLAGDSGHEQAFDDLDFSSVTSDFVIRRSVPHRMCMPDVDSIVSSIKRCGHKVVGLLIVRMADFVLASRHKHEWRTNEENNPRFALEYAIKAYHESGIDPVLVSYETFVNVPEARDELFSRLKLCKPTIETYDANSKYGIDYEQAILR